MAPRLLLRFPGPEARMEIELARRYRWRVVDDPDFEPGRVIRQLTLPSGRRPDLVIFERDQAEVIWVIELKAVAARTKHVGQLMGYIEELRGMYPGWLVGGTLVAPSIAPHVAVSPPGFVIAFAEWSGGDGW